MMKERFEQRRFRIFAQAGYSPVQLLTVTPEEMVEIPGITVPNIRAVLCVLPGALRTSSAMGSYAPQTPCVLCAAKHPLCVCPAPQSLLSPH